MKQGEGTFWELIHAPFMERDLSRREVQEVIAEGSRKARAEAEETIRLARDAMGINYFASERPDMATSRRA